MEMMVYLIVFFIIGFVVTKILKEHKKIIIAIAGISIFWAIYSSFMWGLVALGEMAFAYFLAKFNEDDDKE